MKNTNICAFLLIAFVASPTFASTESEQIPLTYYRDMGGDVSAVSESNAKKMLRIAKQNGHITLWLVLNYEFNINPDSMTVAELDAQTADVIAGFAEVLNPMIRKKEAWLPKAGLTVSGPGTKVRATKKGLRKLLRDERILQLSAIE